MKQSSLYVADLNTFKRLSEIIKNVTHTNIFPAVLAYDKYERINNPTYVKGNDRIKVANIRGEWKYRNLNFKWDTGNIVQFIANRYEEGLRECDNVAVIHASAFIAKQYYQGVKKQLRKEHKPSRKVSGKTQGQSRKQA